MNDNKPPSRDANTPRPYDAQNINRAFNLFLGIAGDDRRLLAQYRAVLSRDSEPFAQVFYEYLLNHPVTAEILGEYRARGDIEHLIRRQLEHLWMLLSGDTGDANAKRLAHIGDVHFRVGIDPVWVMGAYLLYWKFLHQRVAESGEIAARDRAPLLDALAKMLFRDMGLLLEGYWQPALQALAQEKRVGEQLQEQITNLLSNLSQVLWSVDVVENRLLYVSPSTRNIRAANVDVPIPYLSYTLAQDQDLVLHAWDQALSGTQVEVESRIQEPGGEPRWFRRVFRPYRDASGRVVRIDGIMEDATESKRNVERLHRQATTDSLTGLYNRALFNDRLAQALTAASREAHLHVVLLLMDLDRFKEINDTLGHPAGDEILRQVGRRMSLALRDSDTLARLGGDEFAVLLPRAEDGHRVAERVAKKLIASFTRPFVYNEQPLYVGVSIGIALFPEHGDDVDTLMSRADVAMYTAKRSESGLAFYDPTSDPHTPQRLQLYAELRQALARNEFLLMYQPQVDLKTGKVTHAEALIRWQHPQRGLLLPDVFISAAERTGLINQITDWAIQTAAQQSVRWRAAGYEIRIGVNFAPRTLHQANLMQKVVGIIRATGANPACLEIEITENVLLADIEHAHTILEQLSEAGVAISIDDYGSGHSSLAYLKKLPLDRLKIDKSFVTNMLRDEDDAIIVRSTIDLAHNLGYKVVAEGVEDQDTLDILSILGCDTIQGFYICVPLTADALTDWLGQCRSAR